MSLKANSCRHRLRDQGYWRKCSRYILPCQLTFLSWSVQARTIRFRAYCLCRCDSVVLPYRYYYPHVHGNWCFRFLLNPSQVPSSSWLILSHWGAHYFHYFLQPLTCSSSASKQSDFEEKSALSPWLSLPVESVKCWRQIVWQGSTYLLSNLASWNRDNDFSFHAQPAYIHY